MLKEEDVFSIANLLDLSKKDQDLLVEKIRDGNPKEQIAAKQTMLIKSKPVIISISKKYLSYNISFDKLLKLGNKGLIKAVRKYDTSKKYRFIVYATWWIKTEIHKHLGLPIDLKHSKMKKT